MDSPQCHDEHHVFLAPRGFQVSHPSVTILDNKGELVWERYVAGQAYNFRAQEYQGEAVLTFWVGNDLVEGHGEGDFYVLNNRYEEIAKISTVGGLRPDLHEFTITPDGTALMTIYQVFAVREPGIFRLKDTVYIWDCLVLEVNLTTREPLFQWRASEHHSLNESFHPVGATGFSPEHPWDWYHVNSIEKDELGNFLISARFTSTITYVNGTTGHIIWVLGGKQNTFKDLSNGQATNSAYQHLARSHPLTDFPTLLADQIKVHGEDNHKDGITKQLVTFFDNGGDDPDKTDRPSRGALIELTYPTNPGSPDSSSLPFTARLVKSYIHPDRIFALSQGSMQLIPTTNNSDPKVLLGFGYVGVWTEFSADGEVLCDNRFSTQASWGHGHVQSYQALKAPWLGNPTWSPKVTLDSGANPSLFVSWNGATEVKSWKVQKSTQVGDMAEEDWTDIATSIKESFETEIRYEAGDASFLRVVALDKSGNILGTSANIYLGWKMAFKQAMTRLGSIARSPLKIILISSCLLILVILYKRLRQVKSGRRWTLPGYKQLQQEDPASKYV
ncbi:hypothetical protein AAFC00_006095 [Neodothiora populina]